MTDADTMTKTDAEKAQDEANKLAAETAEAHAKADQKEKTPEQLKAEEADQKADDAKAKAAEAKKNLPPLNYPENAASDHDAVKRGNDPSNPAHAPHVSTHDRHKTVKLSRVTKDSPEPVYIMVHPDMVGDYLRAGWSRG